MAIEGFFDIDVPKAETLAMQYGVKAYASLDDLLTVPHLDAVYIATPTISHKELCLRAAQAGKHILCEKSLAMNAAEAEEIALGCQKQGVLIKEGFMYRHHTQHQFVKDMVTQGEIGMPVLFSACFGFPSFPPGDFRMNTQLGGGARLDAGAYVINAARFFFGREPVSSHSYVLWNEQELDIQGNAIADFGLGQTAQLAYGMNNSYKNTYTIWGTKGEIALLRAFSIPSWELPVCRIKTQGLQKEYNLPSCDHFAAELEDFATAIRHNSFNYEEIVFQSRALEMLRDRIKDKSKE